MPLFLVIFGLGASSKIAVGAFSGGLAVAIAVIVSYRNLDPTRMQIADTLGLSAFRRLFWYELPEMAPSLLVGIRTAASLCLILVVVGEMFIGSRDGLGKMIMDMRYSDDVPTLYAAIVLTDVLGFGINKALLAFETLSRRRLGLGT